MTEDEKHLRKGQERHPFLMGCKSVAKKDTADGLLACSQDMRPIWH
jgi:hypothetical protein